MASYISAHARTRMQQRGIRPDAVEALLAYGRVRHLHDEGRELVFFDKKARARLRKERGAAAEAAALARTYAILAADGTVITVGHRYRRVPAA